MTLIPYLESAKAPRKAVTAEKDTHPLLHHALSGWTFPQYKESQKRCGDPDHIKEHLELRFTFSE